MWSYSWAIRNLIAELLMPPGIWIVIALLAILFLKTKPRLKQILLLASLLMMWLTSTNYFAVQLTQIAQPILDWPSALNLSTLPVQNNKNLQKDHQGHQPKQLNQIPQAIVVLGGGRRKGALEASQYEHQDLSSATLERVRYAAKLAKQTQLPVLVTGGAPDRTSPKDQAEATLMAHVFQEEYGIKPFWLEDQSNTTRENAQRSARLLNAAKLDHIYLVTHFWHMPRAQWAFEQEHIQVTPAPMGFYLKSHFDPLDYYPSSEGFTRTRWVWHELMGSLYERIKF